MVQARRELTAYPGFGIVAWACIVLLYAPLIVVTVYSFNALRSITTSGSTRTRWPFSLA